MDRKFNYAASGIAGIFASFLFLAVTIAGVQAYVAPGQNVAIGQTVQRS